MGAYFLNISRRQLLHFQPLHRHSICARSINFMSRPADETSPVESGLGDQPSPAKRSFITTSLSTPSELCLSQVPIRGERTLPVSNPQWKALRTKILLRDKCTCSSCGYISPHPNGRWMVIDHKDGSASNNISSNLRVHCPPCEAIRHCGTSGLRNWLVVGESTMKQVEIVRKTREMFEKTGVIPHPTSIDPSVKPVNIGLLELAGMMRKLAWTGRDLPERYQRLRGFFTEYSTRLFQDTMLTAKQPDTYIPFPMEEPNGDFAEALYHMLDQKALEFTACEHLPWISFTEELYGTVNTFLDLYPPSRTLNTNRNGQAPLWISVHSRNFKDKYPDLDDLSSAWIQSRADGLTTVSDVDKLAERFNVRAGSWLVIVPSNKVDTLWRRIVESTLAGVLGDSAKVHFRSDLKNNTPGPGVYNICIHNADYRFAPEVSRVRDRLRRLGINDRLTYKPDIYTYLGISTGNFWGIPPARYAS